MKTNKHKDLLLNCQNIVIFRTDKLGDMILTLPMFKLLRYLNPNANLHLFHSDYTEPILKFIDKKYNLIYHNINSKDTDQKTISEILKEIKPEIIFNPRPKLNEAIAGFFSSAKLRVGTGYRYYSFLYNHKVYEHRKIGLKNEAEYNLSLIESLLNKEDKDLIDKNNIYSLINFEISKELKLQLKTKLKALGVNFTKRPIILHPSTGGSAKEWHPTYFGKLAKRLSREFNNNILITGIEEDSLNCKKVEIESVYSKNLCGKLTLEEMIILISISKLVVANSTGILHIAAACGIPIVGLYPNSTNIGPKRWSPFTENKIILCPPFIDDEIAKDDMNMIKIEDVMAACRILMKQTIKINKYE